VSEIKAAQETQMETDFGSVISLEKFPRRTHPFWNMKHAKDGIYNKIDLILHGVETIGSAERATEAKEMYESFLNISDGNYSRLLFKAFGKERVMRELDEYLALPFFPRFGAGIGITRLVRAMQLANLLAPSSFAA
jgi:aspartyl/asparaginyl-tRNA synthetase